jgi:hypothetical protein
VAQALRPGGIVVVEASHRDATKSGPIGGAVVFDTNELLQLFFRPASGRQPAIRD